jgi:hypothetical protein
MPETDVEKFTCARKECHRSVEMFAFINERNEKFCSPFCRKKHEIERRQAREADYEDSLPEPA